MPYLTTVETIAHILGAFYIVIAIAMLIRPEGYRKMAAEFFASAALCYTGGILALFLGLVVLALHDNWTGGLNIVVGIIGWLATIKGAVLIIYPSLFEGMTASLTKSDTNLRITGIVA
ncbi:MAG: hypothetical protein HOJ02_04720, partial [Rhodospirillaceae bacterium]|nr:hypothetical protein [Rhodospirillaceae bacterium]